MDLLGKTDEYLDPVLAPVWLPVLVVVGIVGCSSESGYIYIDTRAGRQRVIWRLEGDRIIDVNAGGVWLMPQMRSNFVSVIQRGNGDPAALIDYLRSGRSFG